MFVDNIKNISEILHILDNLSEDTVIELKKLFGETYKDNTFEMLVSRSIEKYLIRLKINDEPVGIFGIIPQSKNSGGIFFLTTKNLHRGNVITLLKGARNQILEWEKRYSLIMDSCYKKNETIKKWLKLLGFKPSEKYQDNDFQVYYKGDIDEY